MKKVLLNTLAIFLGTLPCIILILTVSPPTSFFKKEHKFKFNDTVEVIDGFYKGSVGTVISYNEYDDKYQVYFGFASSCKVKEKEIILKENENASK